MRIQLETLGCRLNIAEIESMAQHFVDAGHRLVVAGDVADVVILNTCAVTKQAMRKSRQTIRSLQRANPAASIIATGCYAQLAPADCESLGVDMVVSNTRKDQLPSILSKSGILTTGDINPHTDALSSASQAINKRTRAFVKVQDGCDQRCTFCITTVARGNSRSRNIDELISQINQLVSDQYKEAIFTGVHLGSYGHDHGDKTGLIQLVRAILAKTSLQRIRLSSLEPWDIGPDIFDLWEDKRLLPHLHLPLQSGCDATLRRMARRTTKADYARLIENAHTAIPHLSITTDIIVGFPGETDADFDESITFIEEMAFSGLHIFRYSPQHNTAAATMPNQVPCQVANERSHRMHKLASHLQRSFHKRNLCRSVPVLWETHRQRAHSLEWSGLTDNYIRVLTHTSHNTDLHNQIIDTTLLDTIPGAVLARITDRTD